MTTKWTAIGILIIGVGSTAWGQTRGQHGSISVSTVYPDAPPGSLVHTQWKASSLASRRPVRVSTLPATAPSLAPESLPVSTVQAAPLAPIKYEVLRYAPVTETQVIPAPVTALPVGPTITDAPNKVFRPVLPLASPKPVYYFGQGLLGQPKLYVPGQPIRNVLRYLTL